MDSQDNPPVIGGGGHFHKMRKYDVQGKRSQE